MNPAIHTPGTRTHRKKKFLRVEMRISCLRQGHVLSFLEKQNSFVFGVCVFVCQFVCVQAREAQDIVAVCGQVSR